jgi:hypothetical protein
MKEIINNHLTRHMLPYVIAVDIIAVIYLVYYFGSSII